MQNNYTPSSIKSVYEIVQGLEIETPFQFFKDNAIIHPDYELRRANIGGQRFYFILDENGKAIPFQSVTSIIDKHHPTSNHLIEWMCNHRDYSDYKRHLNELAGRGTIMHMIFAFILLNRELELSRDSISSLVEEMKREAEIELPNHVDGESVVVFMLRSSYSFMRFLVDCKVEPLMIEGCLKSEKGFAGAMDLICKIEHEGKEITALIDFKSSKAVHDSHAIQLWAYKDMVEENFPELEIGFVGVFRPQNTFTSRTKKEYHLESVESHKYYNPIYWDFYLERALAEQDFKEKIVFDGYVSLSDPESINKAKRLIHPIEALDEQN